jgi:hypothetical protein
MPRKPSIFEKIRLWIFGSKRKYAEISEEYSEAVGACSKCEIRALFISELKKRFKEEHKNEGQASDAKLIYPRGKISRWRQKFGGG